MRHPDDPQTALESVLDGGITLFCFCCVIFVLAYVYDPNCLAPIFGVIR